MGLLKALVQAIEVTSDDRLDQHHLAELSSSFVYTSGKSRCFNF
jgi:hypothetical protein